VAGVPCRNPRQGTTVITAILGAWQTLNRATVEVAFAVPSGNVHLTVLLSGDFANPCSAAAGLCVFVEESVEVISEVGGVVVGSVDEARPATAEEWHPEQVHAWGGVHYSAVVADASGTVEDVEVDPGVVGSVAAGPDDRCGLASAEIEGEGRRCGGAGGIEPPRRVDEVVETGGGGPGVEGVQEPVHFQIGELAQVGD
jgi:hypothetical protein